MIRTFIAIEAPYEVKQVINDAQRYLSRWAYDGVSWTRPEGIHLTLKFLGDVEESALPKVYSQVEQACDGKRVFSLTTTSSGAFPRWSDPHVLWLGITPTPELMELQQAIEEKLNEVGFPKEDRPFHPHLTVARIRRLAPQSPLVRQYQKYSWSVLSWQVEEIRVLSSLLKPGGSEYHTLHKVSLLI